MTVRRMPLITLVLLFLVACGGSAVKRHSYAAQTLDDLAQTAKSTAMTQREVALREAGEAAIAAGTDVNAAVEAAALAYQAKISAVNAFINAKDLYIRAVLAAINKDADLSTILPMLKDALAAYANLQAVFKETIPPIPGPVKEMIK